MALTKARLLKHDFPVHGKGGFVANAQALYRGQNPQNREKRVSGSKNSHFLPFLGHWEMGVF